MSRFFINNFRLPVKGQVYTIRGIRDAIPKNGRQFAFHLYEIVNEKYDDFTDCQGQWIEPGFLSFRFRPVNERKTNIDVFTEMLRTENVS